jgi:pSer/pThr/pTyr-binding forkhead associated (FHA) protein
MSLAGLYQAVRIPIFLALYGFLGLVLWMLWQDIKSTRRLIALTTEPAGELVELSSEQSHTLMPVTSLGRASSNVIALPDPAVSLEHALITRRDGVWWLEDLHSRNGTHLNSHQLETAAVITSGDIVSIGHSRFKIHIHPTSS